MGYHLKRTKMGCGYIPLTRGMVARVSRIDYPRVARFNWCVQNARNNFYACRRESGQFILLHNYVLNVDKGVDHRNGNGLDCRRSNLRRATTKENARNRGPQRNNTSGFKGVSKWKPARGRQGRWQAGIKINGKRIGLGVFETAEEAAAAYDAAARRLHGKFARLNLWGSA